MFKHQLDIKMLAGRSRLLQSRQYQYIMRSLANDEGQYCHNLRIVTATIMLHHKTIGPDYPEGNVGSCLRPPPKMSPPSIIKKKTTTNLSKTFVKQWLVDLDVKQGFYMFGNMKLTIF